MNHHDDHENKKKSVNRARRSFLFRTVTAIPIAAMASMSPTLAASIKENAKTALDNYVPQYFNQEEWEFLLAACEQLIPSDGVGAGALEAHVPIFLDKQMLTAYGEGKLWYMQGPFYPDKPAEMGYQLRFSPKELYRIGISDVDNHCLKSFNQRFCELKSDQQIEILTQLEKGAIELDNIPSHTFFEYLLKNTKEGYFADPKHGGNYNMVSWKLIGFPGARADFMDWQTQYNVKYPYPPVSVSGKRG